MAPDRTTVIVYCTTFLLSIGLNAAMMTNCSGVPPAPTQNFRQLESQIISQEQERREHWDRKAEDWLKRKLITWQEYQELRAHLPLVRTHE